MTRSAFWYLLLAVLLSALLPRLRRPKAPAGRGLYSVDRTNFFASPSGTDPCHTRLYPTDSGNIGRRRPADREIRRRERVRREERT